MKQLLLIPKKKYAKRKVARAIGLRGGNHIVLKSRAPILRRKIPQIRVIIRDTQDRFGVRIRALAIMPDHIHVIVKVATRKQFANSLRFLAGMVARNVAKARLWRQRAWSRPLSHGRDLDTATLYVGRNPAKAGIWGLGDAALIVDGILQV